MVGIVDNEMTTMARNFFLGADFYDPTKPDFGQLDADFNDGLDRETYEKIVHQSMTTRYGYDDLVSQVVLNKYTNWGNVNDSLENRLQYVKLLSEMFIDAPTVKIASLSTDAGVPTFFYSFKLDENNPRYSNWQSSYHAMELNYIFGSPFSGVEIEGGLRRNFTDEERRISHRIMTYWSNFATYGNPSEPAGIESTFEKNWEKFRSDDVNYLRIISDTDSMQSNLKASGVVFWNQLIPQITERLATLSDKGCSQAKTRRSN